ncbi:hypothetical protein F4819DRAFT_498910 [Hypoxylon fuscum]|nr:hypothetical protein F4819DRAFT_498910 [Hypoxylon fuscum]
MLDTTVERVPSLVTSALIVVSVVFPILSLLATGFRYKISSFALSITVWTFAGISGVNFYIVDAWNATIDSNLCLWIASYFNQITLTTVRIAILIFYKRLFPAKTFQIIAWTAIAAVSLWGILFFFLVIRWGDPISKAWTGVGVWRYDAEATGLANVGTSVCFDILVLCLSLPFIFKLHLPTRKKITVSLIFWVGAFCCICSIARLVLLHKVLHEVVDSASNIGVQSTQFCFLIIEPHCSIITASLPCYSPLFVNAKGPESMLHSIRSVFSLASKDTILSDRTHMRKLSATNKQAYPDDKDDRSYRNDGDIYTHDQGVIKVTKGLDVVRDTDRVV